MLLPLLCALTAAAPGDAPTRTHPPSRPVEFIGAAAMPGDERDLSRLRFPLGGQHPHNRLGSLGSAIDYTGDDHVYLLCNDRGPADGAFNYSCRVQRVRILIDADAPEEQRIRCELLATTLLRNEQDEVFTGLASAFDPASEPSLWRRFDPEGVRCVRHPIADAPAGSFFISDEYGPWIVLFAPDGRLVRRLAVPAAFSITDPSGDPRLELPPHNRRGRQPNRGFEGLALTPDGRTLFAFPQSPLIQDGALDPSNERIGINIRVLALPSAAVADTLRQFVYQLEHPGDGVSEVLAIDDARLLVLERDGGPRPGTARRRGVHLADAAHATDVSSIESLPSAALPASIVPMTKSRLLDLTDPAFDLDSPRRGRMPDKIEGLCFGPDLADGRRTLIITTDNDLKPEHATWIWVFAVDVR